MWETIRSGLERIAATDFGKSVILGLLISAIFSLIILASQQHLQSTFPWIAPQTPIYYAVFWAVSLCVFTVLCVLGFAHDMGLKHRQETLSSREQIVLQKEAEIAKVKAELDIKENEIRDRLDEDFLTPVREALKGVWRADYDSFGYEPNGKAEKLIYEMDAIFDISNRKKLLLIYRWRNHPVFDKGEITIEHIALSPEEMPPRIIWFDEPSIPKADGSGNVAGRVFTVMNVVYSEGKPVRLTGTWFDLDGSFVEHQMQYWQAKFGQRKLQERLPRNGAITFERRN